MQKYFPLIYCLFLLISLPLYGDSNSGYFMRFSTSARASALGKAGIAIIEDPAAVYWNPANLSKVKSKQLLLLHSQYFIADVNYDFVSFTLPSENRTIAFAIARLGVDEIADSRTAKFITQGGDWRLDYSKINYFSTADYIFYFSYAQAWKNNIHFGLNAKLLYRNFSSESAFGLGFDAGITYDISKNLQLAGVIQDITTSPIFYSTEKSEFTIPRLRIGAVYHYQIPDLNLLLSPVFQMDVTFDGLPGGTIEAGPVAMDFPIGLEISYSNRFALRAGIDENRQLSLGAGFSLGGVAIDYAFSSYGDDLGNVNVISLKVDVDQLLGF